MTNRVTEALSIRYPLVMGGISREPRLAAAVSEAGGLGCLSGNTIAEQLRANIRALRELTDQRFCVNFPLATSPAPQLQEKMAVITEERVPVVVTSAGSPGAWTEHLHAAGCLVAHVVPTVYHARKAQAAGVDVVIAEPIESGGYRGESEVAMMILIPAIRRALPDMPLVAAGAIADRFGYVAAAALGADGIQLGTRLVATQEAEFPEHYAQLIVAAEDTSTTSAEGRIRPRISKPEFAERVLGENKRIQMGQVAALIDSVVSVEEVFREIFHGGAEHARRVADDLAALAGAEVASA